MARKSPLTVGTAEAKPGKWTTGTLTMGYFPDAPITSPVNILCGKNDGPTLWVQSTIHGTEVGGAIGLLRFFDNLDPAKMNGTIIGLMAANPSAFRAFSRNTPLDGENLNRLFPGDPDGPHSVKTANLLFETAFGVADAMMDLHSGGNEAIVPFYGLYWADGSETAEKSERLAKALGSPDLWASKDDWLHGAMFVNFAKRGKPAVIVECGGGGPVPEEHVENFSMAISGVAKELGILSGSPPRQKKYRILGHCELVFNKRGGYFLPVKQAGDVIGKGEVFGRVMDPHGKIVEELVSPIGPAYLAAVVRPYQPVYSGTMVAECAQLL